MDPESPGGYFRTHHFLFSFMCHQLGDNHLSHWSRHTFSLQIVEKRKWEGLKKMQYSLADTHGSDPAALATTTKGFKTYSGHVKSFFFDLNGQTWPKKRRENKTSSSPLYKPLWTSTSPLIYFSKHTSAEEVASFLTLRSFSHNTIEKLDAPPFFSICFLFVFRLAP